MIRTLVIRFAAFVATMLLFATTGWAYYFYVHYGSRSAAFSPAFEKWDLTALQNNAVLFYISDAGPSAMAPGDTFQAIVSEVRAAAMEWNKVPTSALKLAYGGLFTSGAGRIHSGITVDFSSDLPPGVIALGGPVTYTSPSNGQFVPIQRAIVRVQSDLSQTQTACSNNPCPSFSEYFYVTLVHEFGHAIGLQHTFTSSVMSTYVTSAATKALPLASDDVMGISVLYPTSSFASTMGTIAGQVNENGSGVGMASVVAIAPGRQAISAVTNPDGSYSLTVPPGAYQVYVHQIPPPGATETTPGNVIAPKDQNGNSLAFPSGSFQTQFYPGTQDFSQASNIYVDAGAVTYINFSVQSKPYVSVPFVRTYGYSPTEVPIPSPPILISSRASMVAFGNGLLQNNVLTPGLNISVLGSGSNAMAQVYNIQPWTSGYLAMAVAVGYFASGPQHMIFTTSNDTYVLPSAFNIVNQLPPSINNVFATYDSNGNRVVDVSGTNLTAGTTTILFDGLPGTVTGTASDGSLLVVPPNAPGSYRAAVTALNPDGQSSNYMLQGTAPQYYTYDSASPPALAVSPTTLSPGNDVVTVVGTNTNFQAGQVAVGFRSSDAVVTNVNVLDATHMVINVTVSSANSIPTSSMSVVSGLSILDQTLGTKIGSQSEISSQ